MCETLDQPVLVDVELPEGHHLRQKDFWEFHEAVVLELQQDNFDKLVLPLSVFVVLRRDLCEQSIVLKVHIKSCIYAVGQKVVKSTWYQIIIIVFFRRRYQRSEPSHTRM